MKGFEGNSLSLGLDLGLEEKKKLRSGEVGGRKEGKRDFWGEKRRGEEKIGEEGDGNSVGCANESLTKDYLNGQKEKPNPRKMMSK